MSGTWNFLKAHSLRQSDLTMHIQEEVNRQTRGQTNRTQTSDTDLSICEGRQKMQGTGLRHGPHYDVCRN